jgi:hypothetical protein
MALNIEQAEKDLRGGHVSGGAFLHGQAQRSASVWAASSRLRLLHECVHRRGGRLYGIHPTSPDYAKLRARCSAFAGRIRQSRGRAGSRGGHQKAGKLVEIHIYPGDHAFFNDERPDAYTGRADDA